MIYVRSLYHEALFFQEVLVFFQEGHSLVTGIFVNKLPLCIELRILLIDEIYLQEV
jgi:hypothetical protein